MSSSNRNIDFTKLNQAGLDPKVIDDKVMLLRIETTAYQRGLGLRGCKAFEAEQRAYTDWNKGDNASGGAYTMQPDDEDDKTVRAWRGKLINSIWFSKQTGSEVMVLLGSCGSGIEQGSKNAYSVGKTGLTLRKIPSIGNQTWVVESWPIGTTDADYLELANKVLAKLLVIPPL